MNKNMLYLPLKPKQQVIGWLLAVCFAAGNLLLGARLFAWTALLALLLAAAAAWLLRDFWKESLDNLPLLGKSVWLRPVLATVLNLVICTAVNDIALFYQMPYFVNFGWGPTLWDVRAALLAQQPLFWLIAAGMVLLLPVVEELFFRQLIFSTFHSRSNFLTYVLSVGLFAIFHGMLFAGVVDTPYLVLYSFQFVPMGIFLCWLYCSTDSIFSPIFMHMLCNALVVYAARHY